MNINEAKRVHFIGVGGIGMSALARLCLHDKKSVSGSDRAPSLITDALAKEGVKIYTEQVAENITDDIDFVVYTEAMAEDHPEMVAARSASLPTVNYFEALGQVANDYYLIAVSGTHGKTTTTAMLIDVFEEAGLDPSAVVGSLRSKTKSNYRAGKSKYFIVEACEYKRDFMHLEPDVLVITNLEHEHVDYYKSLTDVQAAFHELALKVPEDGLVICDKADPAVRPVLEGLAAKVVDYRSYLDLNLSLKIPGVHNRLNAAAALAVADACGIEHNMAKAALAEFAGTWRRFEYKGTLNGAPVYDDYAHHPTEIKATIAGTKELYPDKRVVVVFQPHTYSRTNGLFEEFKTALAGADQVLMAVIYSAREENKWGVTSEKVAEALRASSVDASHHDTIEAIAAQLKATVSEDDVVIIMGAGNINSLADELIG